MITGLLSEKLIKVLEAKKEYDKISSTMDYKIRYEYKEYCDLEEVEIELIDVIKQMASGESE